MSKCYLLDLESVALPEARLMEMMPDEIRSPIMPDAIANPGGPDFSKCPAYGGDMERRKEWTQKTIATYKEKSEGARAEWELKASSARQSWMDDAALHAPRSTAKLIAIRDTAEGTTSLMVIDATPEERKRIEAEEAWPCKVKFNFLSETQALEAFAAFVDTRVIQRTPVPTMEKPSERGVLCGYYIERFDLIYLARRAMIKGVKPAVRLRRGRYFDSDYVIDLDEVYKMGERELHVGGMRGLSRILGVEEKEGDGGMFGDLWKQNPISAINYQLKEVLVLEAMAKKMGVL